MEDKIIMSNILTLVKNLNDILTHGTIESATKIVHETFKDSLNSILQLQNDLYTIMEKKGWYQLTNVDKQKLEKAKEKHSRG